MVATDEGQHHAEHHAHTDALAEHEHSQERDRDGGHLGHESRRAGIHPGRTGVEGDVVDAEQQNTDRCQDAPVPPCHRRP
jgi:hypothetical protein